MSVESSKDVKQIEKKTDNDIENLEEVDRQNAQFDQTNDTDEIATVARLAADGAERWISVDSIQRIFSMTHIWLIITFLKCSTCHFLSK